MTFKRIISVALALSVVFPALAQRQRNSIEVDYNHPRKVVVGGVGVEGNSYFNEHQILQLSGLRPGLSVTVPGDDISGIVSRLVAQRYFEDVAVVVDSLNAPGDTAWSRYA